MTKASNGLGLLMYPRADAVWVRRCYPHHLTGGRTCSGVLQLQGGLHGALRDSRADINDSSPTSKKDSSESFAPRSLISNSLSAFSGCDSAAYPEIRRGLAQTPKRPPAMAGSKSQQQRELAETFIGVWRLRGPSLPTHRCRVWVGCVDGVRGHRVCTLFLPQTNCVSGQPRPRTRKRRFRTSKKN